MRACGRARGVARMRRAAGHGAGPPRAPSPVVKLFESILDYCDLAAGALAGEGTPRVTTVSLRGGTALDRTYDTVVALWCYTFLRMSVMIHADGWMARRKNDTLKCRLHPAVFILCIFEVFF